MNIYVSDSNAWLGAKQVKLNLWENSVFLRTAVKVRILKEVKADYFVKSSRDELANFFNGLSDSPKYDIIRTENGDVIAY